MNDLMIMQILDSGGNLFRPLHQFDRRHALTSFTQVVKKRPIRAIFHDNAKNRRLRANPAKLHNIWVVELSQMMDICVR